MTPERGVPRQAVLWCKKIERSVVQERITRIARFKFDFYLEDREQ